MSAGRSSVTDRSVLAVPWEQGSGVEPLWADPTLVPLTCLPLARGSRLRGKCTALGITLLMSAADLSISLPYLVTIMKTVVLQASLNTRERWIFILPAWFLFSCVSWSGLPSYLFWGVLITKVPSILLLQRLDCGRKRSCFRMLCQTGWWWCWHLRSSPKRRRTHRAFHTSILFYPSW